MLFIITEFLIPGKMLNVYAFIISVYFIFTFYINLLAFQIKRNKYNYNSLVPALILALSFCLIYFGIILIDIIFIAIPIIILLNLIYFIFIKDDTHANR